MTKKYLTDPFNALYLYQGDFDISDRPEIQEINEYAIGLEDKIEGDFNLDYIIFEFRYNRLAYVRNGLLLAKLKFLKLYKRFGNGTFATFCREQLEITRWQVNDNIKAARVCMELICAGFEILPTNISQAIALASLTGDRLIHAWQQVIESIEPDHITHKSIRSLLFPPSESDLPVATIRVTPTLHETIHREAADLGISIPEFLWTILRFFLYGGTAPIQADEEGKLNKSANSHLFGAGETRSHRACSTVPLQFDIDTEDYAEKERIWQADLQDLIQENSTSVLTES